MDLQLSADDLELAGGDLVVAADDEAVRQDLELALSVFLAETPYDRAAGVPFEQVLFAPGVTLVAARAILEQKIRSRARVAHVVELDLVFDRVARRLTATGRVALTDGTTVPISVGVP